MLGDWIKQEREARGWTQAELAARAGTSAAYIGHLEAGRRKDPRGSILEGLARAFGISIDEVRKQARGHLDIFPSDQLRAEGLPETHLRRMARLWLKSPERRAELLDSAHSLARATAKFEHLATELSEDDGDLPEVNHTPHAIAS
jgi:transcriptional regulator with XRE-family HTH domain